MDNTLLPMCMVVYPPNTHWVSPREITWVCSFMRSASFFWDRTGRRIPLPAILRTPASRAPAGLCSPCNSNMNTHASWSPAFLPQRVVPLIGKKGLTTLCHVMFTVSGTVGCTKKARIWAFLAQEKILLCKKDKWLALHFFGCPAC